MEPNILMYLLLVSQISIKKIELEGYAEFKLTDKYSNIQHGITKRVIAELTRQANGIYVTLPAKVRDKIEPINL